jgi:hypothetical protein
MITLMLCFLSFCAGAVFISGYSAYVDRTNRISYSLIPDGDKFRFEVHDESRPADMPNNIVTPEDNARIDRVVAALDKLRTKLRYSQKEPGDIAGVTPRRGA